MLPDMQTSGLEQELSQARQLLDTLAVLVDPEDVQAALEMQKVTPSNERLREIAKQSRPCDELLDAEEERPW